MSKVLITETGNYICDCGAELEQKNLNKGICPICSENLTVVMFKKDLPRESPVKLETPVVNPQPVKTKPKSTKVTKTVKSKK